MYCRVLQRVAVSPFPIQRRLSVCIRIYMYHVYIGAECCSVLQRVAVFFRVLQSVAVSPFPV